MRRYLIVNFFTRRNPLINLFMRRNLLVNLITRRKSSHQLNHEKLSNCGHIKEKKLPPSLPRPDLHSWHQPASTTLFIKRSCVHMTQFDSPKISVKCGSRRNSRCPWRIRITFLVHQLMVVYQPFTVPFGRNGEAWRACARSWSLTKDPDGHLRVPKPSRLLDMKNQLSLIW